MHDRRTPAAEIPRCGARARRNTSRHEPRGRPARRYSTSARPTSSGNGSRSLADPLPRIVSSPARQSMSSSDKPATSKERNPNRASSVRIAKSRRPTTVERSQLASSRSTCPASRARGSEASRQPATLGTACANGTGTQPSRCRNEAATAGRSSASSPRTPRAAPSGTRRARTRSHRPARAAATQARAARAGREKQARDLLAQTHRAGRQSPLAHQVAHGSRPATPPPPWASPTGASRTTPSPRR